MIKAFLSVSVIVLLFSAASCTRDDSNIYPHAVDSSNTWRVGNVAYQAASPSISYATGHWQINAATDTGTTVNSIALYFNTIAPPTPGRYLVTGYNTGDTTQVLVVTNRYDLVRHTGYTSTGRDSVYAIVTADSTLVHVTLPPAEAASYNMVVPDTLRISANDLHQH